MTDLPIPGLQWGIKASFLAYITGMSDGRWSVSGGAIPTEKNIVVFEPAPDVARPDDVVGDRFLAFRGDVRFAGHFGMLFVRIADPWITVRAGEAELTVLDPYEPEVKPRLPLVRFTLETIPPVEGLELFGARDVRLTEAGAAVFNDSYPPGEPFEPLVIVLPTTTET